MHQLSESPIRAEQNNQIGTTCFIPWNNMKALNQGDYWDVEETGVQPTPRSNEIMMLINSEKSIKESLGIEASASVGFGPFSMSNTFSSLSSYAYNELSATFVFNYIYARNLDPTTHRLVATDLLKKEVNAIQSKEEALDFLQQAGTGVITELKSGFVFSCIISIEAQNSTSRQEISNELNTKYGNTAELGVAISHMSEETRKQIQIKVATVQSGGSSQDEKPPSAPVFEGEITAEKVTAYFSKVKKLIDDYTGAGLAKAREEINRGEGLPVAIDYDFKTTNTVVASYLTAKNKADIESWLEACYLEFEQKANDLDQHMETWRLLAGEGHGTPVEHALKHLEGNTIQGKGGFRPSGPTHAFTHPLSQGKKDAKAGWDNYLKIKQDSAKILSAIDRHIQQLDPYIHSESVKRATILLNTIYFDYWPLTKVNSVWWAYYETPVKIEGDVLGASITLAGEKYKLGTELEERYKEFITMGESFLTDTCYFKVGWYERPGQDPVPFVLNCSRNSVGKGHYYSFVCANVGCYMWGARSAKQAPQTLQDVLFSISFDNPWTLEMKQAHH